MAKKRKRTSVGMTPAERRKWRRDRAEFLRVDDEVYKVAKSLEHHQGNIWEVPKLAKLSKKRDKLMHKMGIIEGKVHERKRKARHRRAAARRRTRRVTLNRPK